MCAIIKLMVRKGSVAIVVALVLVVILVIGGIWYYEAHQTASVQPNHNSPRATPTSIGYLLTATLNRRYGAIINFVVFGSSDYISCINSESPNDVGGTTCPPWHDSYIVYGGPMPAGSSVNYTYTFASRGALPPGLSFTNMIPPSLAALKNCVGGPTFGNGSPCPASSPLPQDQIGITGTATQPGSYPITVIATNASGTSMSQGFTITVSASGTPPTPSIQSLSPVAASVGMEITIMGTHFGASNDILLDGALAVAGVFSSGTSLTFTLPSQLDPRCTQSFRANIVCLSPFPKPVTTTYSVSVISNGATSNGVPLRINSVQL
jgi:hypothetical protein